MGKLPWVMMQEWHDVYFLHWPIAPKDIQPYVPQELEIDTFNNTAWLGIVFFQMKNMRARWMPPIPGMSSFLELNVRTYVKRNGRSGVYFFSLDVNQSLVAKIGKVFGILPFRYANITSKENNHELIFQNRFEQTKSNPEILIASVEPMSELIPRTPLEYWFTERHQLWTKVRGRLIRQYNRHSPWNLQRATCFIHENSMAPFLMDKVQEYTPLAHYSKCKKTLLYLPVKES